MLCCNSYGHVIRLDLAGTLAGQGRYWTTCYWAEGVLIDTGCAHTARELVEFLKDLPLHGIINTHSHEDHIGGNGPMQRGRPGLSIQAHPLALPVLANPGDEQPLHPYRRLFWGWPRPSTAQPLQDGQWIESGGLRFRVLYTPGHSIDHLCLFEENHGWLFSGDLFVGRRDRALRHGCDIWAIIASLERVLALPVSVLFPGSARVRENPSQEIRSKIEYYRQLGERIADYHRKGWQPEAIVRAVCGGPMWVEYVTLGHFARKWLVYSYLNALSQNVIQD